MNIINENTYAKYFSDKLERDKTSILPYNTNNKIKILGKFTGIFHHNTKETTADIFVVEGKGESLLSYHTSVELELVKITLKIGTQISTTDIEQKYPKLCNGVGKLSDLEIKLHLDQNVQPIAQKHRRIPFHLRQKVDEEINSLI